MNASSNFRKDWHGFAVIEELYHEDNSLSNGVDPNLQDLTKYWGPDYFVDEVTLPSGTKRQKLNYFV